MTRGMKTLTVLAATLLVLGGCGAAKKANEARQAVGDIKEAADNLESGSTGDKELDALLARAETAQTSTFRARYEMDSGGSISAMTIAQKGKKSKFEVGDDSGRAVFLDDGTDTYSCFPFGEDGELSCTKGEGEGGQGSMATAAIGFSPATMLASIRGVLPLVGASLELEHFSDTKAGQGVDCVRFTYTEGSAEGSDGPDVFCISKAGIWAYSEQSNGDTVELVDYSEEVDDDEFDVPGKVVDPADGYPAPEG